MTTGASGLGTMTTRSPFPKVAFDTSSADFEAPFNTSPDKTNPTKHQCKSLDATHTCSGNLIQNTSRVSWFTCDMRARSGAPKCRQEATSKVFVRSRLQVPVSHKEQYRDCRSLRFSELGSQNGSEDFKTQGTANRVRFGGYSLSRPGPIELLTATVGEVNNERMLPAAEENQRATAHPHRRARRQSR